MKPVPQHVLRARFGAKASRQLAPRIPVPRWAYWVLGAFWALVMGIVVGIAGALAGWW